MLLRLLSVFPLTSAHSWLEQAQRINASGFYNGYYGYPRHFVSRADPHFEDAVMTNLLPSQGRTQIEHEDQVCLTPSSKRSTVYPRLYAAPGDFVALKYLENGHVTQPGIPPGKPDYSGTVAVFARTQTAKTDPSLLEILSWSASGSLTSGRLLTAQPFDDGRCYQINSASSVSVLRQYEFPNYDTLASGLTAIHEQWCEAIFRIPGDAPPNSTLLLYWIWSWPTLESNVTRAKDEFYTSCLDVSISSVISTSPQWRPLPYQDPQRMAVKNFRQRAHAMDTHLMRPTREMGEPSQRD